MITFDDMNDDEIRPIGNLTIMSCAEPEGEMPKHEDKPGKPWRKWLVVALVAVALVIVVAWMLSSLKSGDGSPADEAQSMTVGIEVNDAEPPTELLVTDTVVKGHGLQVISVDNLVPSLHVGLVDTTDASIRLVLQAADYRADNGEIVGDYVLRGEVLSTGTAKNGYCEINDNQLAIGNSDESGCKQCAIDQCGYFFRQYLLVSNGEAQTLKPKGSHLRRALCMTEEGHLFIVLSKEEMTFNQFAKVLASMPVCQAIYLTGGSAYGFYRTLDGAVHHLGYPIQTTTTANVNYLVFR